MGGEGRGGFGRGLGGGGPSGFFLGITTTRPPSLPLRAQLDGCSVLGGIWEGTGGASPPLGRSTLRPRGPHRHPKSGPTMAKRASRSGRGRGLHWALPRPGPCPAISPPPCDPLGHRTAPIVPTRVVSTWTSYQIRPSSAEHRPKPTKYPRQTPLTGITRRGIFI